MTTTAKAKAARKAKTQATQSACGAADGTTRQPAAAPAKDMRSPAERFAAALRASVDYEPPPRDSGGLPEIDKHLIRLTLARRMVTFMRLPPRCGEPACRRTRRCVGPTMRCNRDIPKPELTPEESEAAIADFRAKLAQRARGSWGGGDGRDPCPGRGAA